MKDLLHAYFIYSGLSLAGDTESQSQARETVETGEDYYEAILVGAGPLLLRSPVLSGFDRTLLQNYPSP